MIVAEAIGPRGRRAAETPEPVLKKLEAAFLQIAKDPQIQAQMKKEGFVPLAMGHAESKAHIAKMTGIYREIVQDIKK